MVNGAAVIAAAKAGQVELIGGLNSACPAIEADDMDGVRAMYRSVIQRAIHDACGAVVVARSAVQQKQIALDAWNFLYSHRKDHADDRAMVCALAQVDHEFLERRMVLAAIPRPTEDTLRNAWTELELAYWRLAGQPGEKPVPRPENSRGLKAVATHAAGNEARRAKGYRVGPSSAARRLSGGAGDRRDAGQTLLFRKPGVPVRPKFGMWGGSSGRYNAQLELPLARTA